VGLDTRPWHLSPPVRYGVTVTVRSRVYQDTWCSASDALRANNHPRGRLELQVDPGPDTEVVHTHT
jgi:hypothetical protein